MGGCKQSYRSKLSTSATYDIYLTALLTTTTSIYTALACLPRVCTRGRFPTGRGGSLSSMTWAHLALSIIFFQITERPRLPLSSTRSKLVL
eukprot:jgi/Mesvir1/23888/Mv25234-RA.1